LKTVARELEKYDLDLVGVKRVRWEKGGTVRAEDYTLFYGEGNEDHLLGTDQFIYKRIISAVRRVEFISDRLSYAILRGHCCNIIVFSVHAPREDKNGGVKGRHYEETGYVLVIFLSTIKNLLGDFSEKVGREDIFKSTVTNKSLLEISNENGVRVVNFATFKNFVVKSTIFPHHNVYKSTWACPEGKRRNRIHHVLIDRRRHSSIRDVLCPRWAGSDHYLVVEKVRERLAESK
jgi:hypothetical protein